MLHRAPDTEAAPSVVPKPPPRGVVSRITLATSGSLLCSISDAEPNTSTPNPTD